MKKNMIQGLPAHFGGLDEYTQIFNELRLAGKIVDGGRPDVVLKLLLQGA